MILNSRDVAPGAWVRAGDFINPEADRAMRVLRMVEHNGRPAFEAMVSVRAGETIAMPDRMVWRYVSQVNSIVRKAR